MEEKLRNFYTHKIKMFEIYENKYNVTLLYYFLNTKTIIESLSDILDLSSERQKKYLSYLHHSKDFKKLIFNLNDNNDLDNIINFYLSPEVKANFIFHQNYYINHPIIRKLFLILSFIQDNYKLILLITLITFIVIQIIS